MSFGKTYGPSSGSNMQNAASAYFNNKQKQEQETAYQQNLSQPQQETKWYVGDKPTRREYVGKIMSLYKDNDPKYQEALDYYRWSQGTPGTSWYQPYTQVTNSAVASLAALGVDTTGIDTDDWFTQNAYMQNWFTSNDGSNEVKKPGKNATAEEWVGYYYRQAYKQKETTSKAKTEWEALQQELTYKTQNPYRNSTDQEIIDSIDWNKYPTLVAMDKGRDAGVPVELNGTSDYCRDALDGVIWAARNPNGQGGYGTGNTELNMAYSAMGIGNQYQADPELRGKLDPVSPSFSPYSVGPAGAEANALCLYFGVYELTPQWVKENENLLNDTDPTKKNNYIKAANIVSYTNGLKNSLDIMNGSIDYLLESGSNADTIIRKIFDDGYVAAGLDPTGEVDYKDLLALDETMTGNKNRGEPKNTGYAIDYKRSEMEERIRQKCEERDNKQTEFVQNETGTDARGFQHDQRNLGANSDAILDYGTESERRVLKCGINGPIAVELMTGKANAVPSPDKLHEAGKKTLDNLALETWYNARNADGIKKAEENIDELNRQNIALGVESRFNNMMDSMGVDQEKRDDYRAALDQFGNAEAFNAIRDGWNQDEFMRTITPDIYAGTTDVYSDTRLNFRGLPSDAAMDAAGCVEDINLTLGYLNDHPEDKSSLMELYSLYMDLQGYISGEGEYYPDAGQDALLDMFLGRGDGVADEEAELDKARMLRDLLLADKTTADEALSLGQTSYYLEGAEKQQKNDAEIADNEQAIADLEQKMTQYMRLMQQAPLAISMYKQDGSKYNGDTLTAIGNIYDIVNSDLPDREWDSYSVFDMMDKAYKETNGESGAPHDDVVSYAKYAATNNPLEVRRIKETVKFLQDNGFVFPQIDMDKINRKIDELTTEARQASYYLLNNRSDFGKNVEEGKQMAAASSDKLAHWVATGEYIQNLGDYFAPLVDSQAAEDWYAFYQNNAYEFLTKEDKERYFYLIKENNGDPTEANRYLRDLFNPDNGIMLTRVNTETQQKMYDYAKQNGFTALLSTASSLASKAVAGPIEFAYRKAVEAGGGNYNPNNPIFIHSSITTGLREGSKERFATDVTNLLSKINDKTFTREKVEKVTDFLYDMAISGAADSAINGLITSAGINVIAEMIPFESAIGQAIAYIEGGGMGTLAAGALKVASDFAHAAPMGVGAAESAYREAILNGASKEKAEKMAVMTFYAETLSEAITFSNMKGMVEAGKTGEIKNVVMQLLGDSLEEAFGEGMNELVEQHFDKEIMGAASEWAKNYQDYIDAGYTPTMASEMADREMWNGVLKSALSGAMSSWLTGGLGYVAGKAKNTSIWYDVTRRGRGTVDSIIEAGLTDTSDAESYDLASKLRRDLAEGKRLKRNEVGRLTVSLLNSSNESVRTTVENALNGNRRLTIPGNATGETAVPEWYDESKDLAMLLEASADTSNTGASVTNIGAVMANQSGLSTSEALATAQTMVTKAAGGDSVAAAQTMSGLIQNAAQDVVKQSAPAVTETAQATTETAPAATETARTNIEEIRKIAPKDRTIGQQIGLALAEEAYKEKASDRYVAKTKEEVIENAAKEIASAKALAEGLDPYSREYSNRTDELVAELTEEAKTAVIPEVYTETVGPETTTEETTETAEPDISPAERIAQTKKDVAFATMTDGAANAALTGIIESVKAGNQVTAEDVALLHDAVVADQTGENGEAMNDSYAKAVADNRIANRVTEKLSTDEVTEKMKKETKKIADAKVNLNGAYEAVDKAQARVNAASENLSSLANEDIGDPNVRQVLQNAAQEKAGAVRDLEAAKAQLETQKSKYSEVAKEVAENKQRIMDQVRAEATTEVQQEIAQEQEQARQEEQARKESYAKWVAEQQRIKAEQDERSGKTWEQNRDEIIDKILDNEYLEEGERREARRAELTERANMIHAGKINMAGMMNSTEGLLATGILGRQLGVEVAFTSDPSILPNNAAGKYKDGVVYLNENLIKSGKMTIGQAVMEIALHEFTHYMEGTKAYSKYSNTVLDFLFQGNEARLRAAVDSKIADYQEKFGKTLTETEAKEEIVADFAKNRLNDRDVISRFISDGIAGKIRNALHNINQAIKNFRLTGVERQTAEYLRKTERLYQKMIEQAAKSATHPDGDQFSIAQLAEAANLDFNQNTLEIHTQDGQLVDGVKNKITPQMLENTPVGMLIGLAENGLQNKKGKYTLTPTISKETAKAQRKMFADLANMAAQYRDSDLVWEIASSTLFSAMKSNSDPQYSTTVDFGTICAKTQEIINVMSRVMLEKGRGLTREEVLKVYNETANAGLTVPCPVCYVFSRWMGVPSLLGQMSDYQKRFVKTRADGSIDVAKTQKAANDYIKSALEKYGDKEGIDKAKTSLTNRLKTQEKNRTEALKVIASETATEQEKAVAKEKHDKAISTMDILTKELGEVEAFNWVTQALCKQQRKGKQVFNVLDKNGNYIVDDQFQLTPDDVLFDLRRTGDFAKYTKNWAYRNTRGAGMGKAIMPYSGMSIGDVIYGTTRKLASANPFLVMDPQTAAKGVNDAIARAVKQNLIGGQRLQSTSDFRPEWGLDYLMTFLELQAIGSKVQMYTKVAEAVPLLASMGADINLSIMGKGKGWHVDENGHYVLDFSDVTGMKYETAKALKDRYSNVQMILVGMNDTHIRLVLADSDIDFVIPWHASGNSKDTLSSLVSSASIGQEQLETSSDYTDTQSDKASDNQTEEQKQLWKLRMKILQGKKINAQEREIIYQDEYLAPLYDRFNVEGVDPDCYHVKLGQDQAKQIFPYEYWDKGLTKEQADGNGQRFVDYCLHFGITPRFSGTVKHNEDGSFEVTGNFAGAVYDDNGNITGYDPAQMAKGYWKVLIDRPMYDNDGNYRDQQVVDVTKANIGMLENGKLVGSDMPLTTSAMYGPNYSEQEKNAVDNSLAAIEEQNDLDRGQMSDGGASLTELDNFEYMKPFDEQVDDYISMREAIRSGKENVSNPFGESNSLLVSGSPDVFELIGLPSLPVTINQEHLAKCLYGEGLKEEHIPGHTFSAEEFKKLPEKIADPIAIGYDPQSTKQVIVYVDMQNNNGEQVIIPLRIGGIANIGNIESNALKLNTAFSLQNNQGKNLLESSIKNDTESKNTLFYLNEKKAAESGVAPDVLNIKNLTDSGLIHRITDLGSPVKIDVPFWGKGKQFGKWFRDSKVVNDDGSPMIVYHGTTEDFTAFDMSKGRSTMDIQGAFFSPWEEDSAGYGDKVKSYYLSIQNPANEAEAYKALNMFKGQNEAGKKAREYLISHGYDGVINGVEGQPEEFIAFYPWQIKSATDNVGLYDRNNDDSQYSDGGASLTDLDQELINSGVITQEDLDAYYAQAGSEQRQFGSQRAQESNDLSDLTKRWLRDHSAYTKDTNKAQIDRAAEWIKGMAKEDDPDGYHAAVDAVTADDFDYRSADGQARMITVMSMAASRGDTAAELKIADAYNKQGTDLGRQLQARKLFRLMDPIGRRMALQQEVARINQEYKNSNKDIEVELSETTLKAAEAAETEEDFAKVQNEAMKELAAQMPANWKEKLRTWRMVSMLANPRTHIRNILGNWIFKPVVGLKNAIGAGLESKFVKEGGERTKAIRYTDDAKAFAKQDVETMRDVLTGEAKYSPESKIEQNKKAFGQGKGILSKTLGRAVQAVSDLNSNLLEQEDWWFLNGHYQNAMASYMTANNLRSEDMTGDTLERAREYAILEAQKATYRDANVVSTWLNRASRRGGLGGFLVDTVLPFKKTPANILRRGIEYSPIGLISSLATAKRSLDLYAAWDRNGRKGNMPKGAKSLTQVLDGVASGLTGTAIAGLGALAYALGYVKLDLGDDDELEKERGSQEYSIEAFGHSFTIDWAAPVCMPFFTGAALYKEIADRAGGIENADDAAKLLGSVINGLSGISEPVFNLSMLEGVSSLLKSASYSNTDRVPIFELGQNIAANYVGSLVPSVLGAVARTIDTTRRQNYVESGDPLRIWKQKIEQAQNKIPFLSMYNIPYRDVYGNTDTSSGIEAFLENFILPGYLNEMKKDKTIDELERIFESGEDSVIPSAAKKKVGDVALNDQQYDQYRVTRGQTAKAMLDDLVNREDFQALTGENEEAQAKLIEDVWTYANAVARHELFPDYKMVSWVSKAYASDDPVGSIIQREEKLAQDAYAEDAAKNLYLAIDKQDAEAVNTCLEALKKAGKEDKNIRTSLMNHYRPLYKQAILDGDTETADAIQYGMMMLDLGNQSFKSKTFVDWAKDAIKNGVD